MVVKLKRNRDFISETRIKNNNHKNLGLLNFFLLRWLLHSMYLKLF